MEEKEYIKSEPNFIRYPIHLFGFECAKDLHRFLVKPPFAEIASDEAMVMRDWCIENGCPGSIPRVEHSVKTEILDWVVEEYNHCLEQRLKYLENALCEKHGVDWRLVYTERLRGWGWLGIAQDHRRIIASLQESNPLIAEYLKTLRLKEEYYPESVRGYLGIDLLDELEAIWILVKWGRQTPFRDMFLKSPEEIDFFFSPMNLLTGS